MAPALLARKLLRRIEIRGVWRLRRMFLLSWLKRHPNDPIVLRIRNRTDGFASILTQALLLRHLFRDRVGQTCVAYGGWLYSGGGGIDLINEFFEQDGYDPQLPHWTVPSAELLISASTRLPLSEACGFWTSRFLLRNPHVAEELLSRVSKPFLAAHYRGTDKSSEACLPPVEAYLREVREAFERFGCRSIVAFSDDSAVLDEFAGGLSFAEVHTVYPTLNRRISGPIHRAKHASRADAEDALRLMLVMAQAEVVVRTPSSLSAWGKILNPGSCHIRVGKLKPWMVRCIPEVYADETRESW